MRSKLEVLALLLTIFASVVVIWDKFYKIEKV